MNNHLSGVVVALLTPMQSDHTLDLEAFSRLCRFVVSRGASAVLVAGTTGEGPLLSRDERRQLVRTAVAAVGQEAIVAAHVADVSTAGSVQLARDATDAGAHVLTALSPWFYAQDERSLQAHYAALAEATSLPLYLYNLPARSGSALPASVVAWLRARYPRVAGIKDSGGDLYRFQEYQAAGGEGFISLWGPDGMALGALAHGAAGLVSGNANFVPELIVGLYRAWRDGNFDEARRLQAQVQVIRAALKDGGDLGLFKWATSWRGIPMGDPRPPLQAPTAADVTVAQRALRDLGFRAVSAETVAVSA